MKKADLHCHSIYSEHPDEWFLKKLGTKESYTDPETIYNEALRAGMDYVTITDHNRIDGALLLKERHPDRVIVGVESTTYFPEDNCKIHILIYGIDEVQFAAIDHMRKDIYELRDYLRNKGIAHSVAHASYSVNGKLQTHHLEKLILLFDHFESNNGGRNKRNNLEWTTLLSNLTPAHIEDLRNRYQIEPFGDQSWIKGFTGGSDDHAGIFVGRTYTETKATNIGEFLDAIREKRTQVQGRHNNYQALAFTVYKIAYDFSKNGSNGQSRQSLLQSITENLFENRGFNLKRRFQLETMKTVADWRGDELKRLISELVTTLRKKRFQDIEQKLEVVYDQLSDISDAYFRILLGTLEDDLKDINLIKIIRNISSSLPGIFLILPFFTSLKHMHRNLELVNRLRQNFGIPGDGRKRRTLWLTDTINDLNGVSVTLKQMGQIAFERGRELRIVSSLEAHEITFEIPDNFTNLPNMYIFNLPYYENYRIKVPSILRCLKLISDYEPDQIIISTPGPIGMLALLAAKLLNINCIGIYHTDFTSEARHLITDEALSETVLRFERWFYNQMDEIRSPTTTYLNILEKRDIRVPKMGLLRRGIDLQTFTPMIDRKSYLHSKLRYPDGLTLLYAGRVSKDKSLDLLAQAYIELVKAYPKLNLVIAGNGPYLEEMRMILSPYLQVFFAGAMPRNELPALYNAADYFVFPSISDTFGMVILEAQACGLPVIVSDQGGPKEIMAPDVSGFVVTSQSVGAWVNALSSAIGIFNEEPIRYEAMRLHSREQVAHYGDWDSILEDILGSSTV